MAMFKQCADIQTADMLKLPVPALVGGKPTNIRLKPSETQKQMVAELGERADKIRNREVKPYVDNMLKITNDGRKLALDQRLIDPDLPDDPDSKVNICVGKVFEIWEQTKAQRSAQLVFCDLSTPKAGVFNVYDDMKAKLIERGIPEAEIAPKTDELLLRLGLEKERDTLVKSLPLGWKQKLAFSVSIFHRPKIVFLDEPTGGVDPATRRQFWELIYQAADEGITVFVTTHFMDEAEYCDRISIMVDGVIRALDTPGELKRQFNATTMDDVFQQLARQAVRTAD